MSSKYAALPDLDPSQDTYETPDLADDVSTLPTSISAADSDNDETEDINQEHLHPSRAAARFKHAEVDARDVDFSDRIAGKRKSYIVSSRRRRRRRGGAGRKGDGYYGSDNSEGSEEEEGEVETVERRLARLRREVEEVKAELEGKELGGIRELAEALEELQGGEGARGRLVKRVAAGLVAAPKKEAGEEERKPEGGADKEKGSGTAYTVTYAPSYKKDHTLGKVADFDQRLGILEKVLGVSASAIADLDQQLPSAAMIPTLQELSRQMEVLNTSTTSSLDSASRRVKQLATETEKLTEARKAAKLAAVEGAMDPMESEETVGKINALYGVLSTIESMKPVLPAMLDRLRSLRKVHQDAGRAAETLGRVERRQEEMQAEIKRWEEALGKLEVVVKEGTGTVEGNVVKVEGWVKEIEEKMKILG